MSRRTKWISALVALAALVGWRSYSPQSRAVSSAVAVVDEGEVEDDASHGEAGDSAVKAGETYTEYDQRRDQIHGAAGEDHGYGCTEDCSGHDAGYQWAKEHSVSDESECGGKSWSFEEGCIAYAEEQTAEEADPE